MLMLTGANPAHAQRPQDSWPICRDGAADAPLAAYVAACEAAAAQPRASRRRQVDAYAKAAARLVSAGEPQRAAALLDEAVALSPRDVNLRLARGSARYGVGDFEAAIEDFSLVTRRNRRSVEGWVGLAQSYEGSLALEAAFLAYDQALGRAPQNIEARLGRARTHIGLGTTVKAFGDLEVALSLEPQNEEARSLRILALRDRAANWGRNGLSARQVVDDLTEVLAADGPDADLLYTRGQAYDRLGEWNEAVEDYTQVLALEPDSVRALVNRGVGYSETDRDDLGLKDFNAALAMDPYQAYALNNRAGYYAEHNDFERAHADFDRAIASDPELVVARYNRGVTFMMQGRYAEALADLDAAVAAKDRSVRQYYGVRAMAREFAGDLDGAIEDLNHAIGEALSPGWRVHRGQLHAIRGDAKLAQADFDQASRAYDKVNAERIDLLVTRCQVRGRTPQIEARALADCDEAVARNPQDESALSARGLLHLRQDRPLEAWADYDAATRANPHNAEALYGRGLAAVRMGRREEGETDLREALRRSAFVGKEFERRGVASPLSAH